MRTNKINKEILYKLFLYFKTEICDKLIASFTRPKAIEVIMK